jgi:predicted homoserine dehydrogenase-like protein
MAAVANATSMRPARPGMAGVQTTLETLLTDFERLGLLDAGPIVEYTLGIPNGVFVVVRSDEPEIQRDFRYLKMGEGPYYVLYRPHVLVHYEAPLSAAEAVLYGAATIAPDGPPVADVATYAKRNLAAGQRLDGIGGFDCYGLIVPVDDARRSRLLPIGLASFARLNRDVSRDEPITLDSVTIEEENVAIRLRREQDAMFAPSAPLGATAHR